MRETHLFVAAHPDDIEAMLGYRALQTLHQTDTRAAALVMTDGTASSVNHTSLPCFCRPW